MDEVKEVKEQTPENRVYFGNMKKDPFDCQTAFYDVLKNMGFNITYDKEGAKLSDGTELPTHYGVFIDAQDRDKIKKLTDEFLQTPESKLLHSASIGDYLAVMDKFVDKKYIKIYDEKTQTYPAIGIGEWVAANGELINRALKLAYLRRAEFCDQWVERSKTDSNFGTPEENESLARTMRQKAEGIQTRALDPEGIRIVTHNKINQILEERPDLCPATNPN